MISDSQIMSWYSGQCGQQLYDDIYDKCCSEFQKNKIQTLLGCDVNQFSIKCFNPARMEAI